MEKLSAIACFGECFLDLSKNKPTPSGFPFSMAFHLKMLGADPILISRVGLDDHGKRIIQFMEEKGLSADCFQVDYDLPTGIQNNLKADTTEAWNNLSDDDSCFRKIHQSALLIHSTNPMAFKASGDVLLSLIKEKNRRLVYIAPGFSNLKKDLVQHCLQDAYILYLHIRELDLLTGWFSPYPSITDRIAVLQNNFKVSCVIVIAEEGGYFVNIADSNTHFIPAEKKPSASNSGTAFLAGFLSNYMKNKPAELGIEFGIRLHQFVYASPEEYIPYTPGEIPN